MKVIIAGSRDIVDYNLVLEAVKESGFNITEVVCGKARGVDSLGERWANENNIPVIPFPPNYELHGGKMAGMIRNSTMANYGEALILVWDGKSNGSRDMLSKAMKKNLPIFKKIVTIMKDDET